jgi:hypothetical protein
MNSPTFDPMQMTRRHFLGRAATGIGAAALAALLNPRLPGASRSDSDANRSSRMTRTSNGSNAHSSSIKTS